MDYAPFTGGTLAQPERDPFWESSGLARFGRTRLAIAASSSKWRPACSRLPTPSRQCARSHAKPGSESPRSTGTSPAASL